MESQMNKINRTDSPNLQPRQPRLTVSALPGVNRIVQYSDYGYREMQRQTVNAD
ncbi:MAG: hypothetical protein JWR19_1288, partial [Pedosphaera sp.]|nr:hypothetical protein [Pedosphaera sp.]